MSNVIPSQRVPSKQDLIRRITLIEGDITQQGDVDAIVSSISTSLDCGGSLNACLIERAGIALDDFILEHIHRPRPGDVFAVPAFDLPVKHILYVVTPTWRSGFDLEERDLLRCYRGAMETAQKMRLKKIAFPALGTGGDGFPLQRAARLAVQGIRERLIGQLEEIRIVCNRADVYGAFAQRLKRSGRGQDV